MSGTECLCTGLAGEIFTPCPLHHPREAGRAHLEKMKEHTECCGTPMVRALLDGLEREENENAILRAALSECAVAFDQSNSPAVAGAMASATELQRRIKVAASILKQ